MHVVRVEQERRKKERKKERERERERMRERKCECAKKKERKKERDKTMSEATTRRVRDKACKVPRDVIRALDTGRRTVVSES